MPVRYLLGTEILGITYTSSGSQSEVWCRVGDPAVRRKLVATVVVRSREYDVITQPISLLAFPERNTQIKDGRSDIK